MRIKYFTFLFIIAVNCVYGQDNVKPILPKDSLYLDNIKKSRLYGVYIPRDIDDALAKLMELTDEDARKPLMALDEGAMARKLYFGLGRWMEYNWNFEEGSRFSHYLRLKGLVYTEDMTRFMLVTFHRHIIKSPLMSDKLIAQFILERKQKIKDEQEKMKVLQSVKKIIPKNE